MLLLLLFLVAAVEYENPGVKIEWCTADSILCPPQDGEQQLEEGLDGCGSWDSDSGGADSIDRRLVAAGVRPAAAADAGDEPEIPLEQRQNIYYGITHDS